MVSKHFYLPIVLALTFIVPAHAASQSPTTFFPPQMVSASNRCGPWMSDFEVGWYSGQLSAAEEPSLYLEAKDPGQRYSKSYRFTWLRSFHVPITVRIDEAANGQMLMTAKRLTGKGGYEPGKVGAIIHRSLSPTEVTEFRRISIANNEIKLDPVDCSIMGMDGAQWILETRIGSEYHYVIRWSPQKGLVRETGLYLLKLTGWSISPIY
jgi:hypothetical protein